MNQGDERLAKILSRRVQEQTGNDINNIVKDFKAATSKPNRMSLTQFRKYEKLFSTEYRARIANNKLSELEKEEYRELSQELLHSIDPYKAIVVVDEVTGKVYPPIPPIYRRLNHLAPGNSDIMEEYQNAYLYSDGNPNGLMAIRQAKANYNVTKMVMANQTLNGIHHDQAEYEHMRADFLNAFNDTGPKSANAANTKSATVQPAKSDAAVDDDILNFDF